MSTEQEREEATIAGNEIIKLASGKNKDAAKYLNMIMTFCKSDRTPLLEGRLLQVALVEVHISFRQNFYCLLIVIVTYCLLIVVVIYCLLICIA